MNPVTLWTSRLRLRELEAGDWPAVYAYRSDALVKRYERFFEPNIEREVRELLRRAVEDRQQEPRLRYHFGVILCESERLIGECALLRIRRTLDEAVVGWMLHRDYWRQGIGTETGRALLRFGFETLGLRRIQADCSPDNIASWRLMEKIGMQRVEDEDTSALDTLCRYEYAISAEQYQRLPPIP
ncbi:MAG TPA: GNAT family N-acetyltransferase [Chthonomonadaceae bacterium]|nr:GNAT family N-acetyltransferase [Chthonomonadaceae bacterium]